MDVTLTARTVLLYEYVDNALEARAPHRAGHIGLFRRFTEEGRILMGGAYGDPPKGAVIVFASEDPADAEEFAAADPYVEHGVVTSWRVEPYNVVA